jgi:tetratricopeptide (TPR) repeat protein
LAELDEERDTHIAAPLLRALVQATKGDKLFEWGARAATVFERVGDRMGRALLHSHLGHTYRRLGHLDEAEAEFLQATDIFAGLPRLMPYTSFLQQRWQMHRDRGRYPQALSDIAEGIAIVNSLGDADAYFWRLFDADVHAAMGELDEAIREAEAVLEMVLSDPATYPREIYYAYKALALSRFGAGDVDDGAAAAREMLLCTRRWQSIDEPFAEAMHLAAIAAALRGHRRVAAKLWAAVETHYDRIVGSVWRERDHLLVPASIRQLVLQEMDSLRAQGGAQPLDAIITEALSVLSA